MVGPRKIQTKFSSWTAITEISGVQDFDQFDKNYELRLELLYPINVRVPAAGNTIEIRIQ